MIALVLPPFFSPSFPSFSFFPLCSLSLLSLCIFFHSQCTVPVQFPEACKGLPLLSSPHTLFSSLPPTKTPLKAPMQPGKNPAPACAQHATFIFTYLFPPISCTHKLLQLITAKENHSCRTPTPRDSIELPGDSQAASQGSHKLHPGLSSLHRTPGAS